MNDDRTGTDRDGATDHAVVLAAHGSLEHGGAPAAVRDVAERLRSELDVGAVRPAFWKQRPSIAGVLRRSDAAQVTVVPLFTSDGYFANRVVPREVAAGADANPRDVAVTVTDPVGTHPAYTEALRDAAADAYGGDRGDADLIVVGHGTERTDTSAAATRRHAGRLVDDGWRDVHVAFLDEPPYVDDIHGRLDDADGARDSVVVVPFFVAPGMHVEEDIPEALGVPEGARGGFAAHDRRVHYADPAGVRRPALDAIRDRADVEDRGSPRTDRAGRGVPDDAAESFAEAVATDDVAVWGEIALRPLDDAVELRHVDDLDETVRELDAVDGIRALEEHTTTDDSGAFRPQAGERSLPTGWRLVVPSTMVAAAVDAVYPGTVADRYGVSPSVRGFDAVAGRQTGMYDGLQALDDGRRRTVADAVCGACRLERCWPVDDGDDPPAPDEAEAPCTAPCPLLLEVARASDGWRLPARGDAVPPTRDELLGTDRAPVDDADNAYRRALHREEVTAP